MQALLFADGGLSALGLNIVNMARDRRVGRVRRVRRAAGGAPAREIVDRRRGGIAAGLSVPLAALGFTLQYAIGGNDATSVSTVAVAMVGVHLLIGIGEGVITAMTVSAVMAVRPDLVYGARGYAFAPVAVRIPVTTAVGGLIAVRRNIVGLVVAGLVVAVALATFVSPFASSSPDGLEKVAADKALDTEVDEHAFAGGPLADYGVEGVDNERVWHRPRRSDRRRGDVRGRRRVVRRDQARPGRARSETRTELGRGRTLTDGRSTRARIEPLRRPVERRPPVVAAVQAARDVPVRARRRVDAA